MNKEFEFQKSEVYLQIVDYITKIYKLTEIFPKEELYNLTQQLKRASTSIALNFAEGWGRFNKKEKAQFYKIARASLFECVSILDIALKLNYINPETYKKNPERKQYALQKTQWINTKHQQEKKI